MYEDNWGAGPLKSPPPPEFGGLGILFAVYDSVLSSDGGVKCGVMTSPSNGHPYSMSPFHAHFIHEFKLSNQYPKSLKQLINN